MSFLLEEVHSASAFPAVMRCYFAAFASPPSPFTPLLAPLRGTGPTALDDAIQEFTARSWFSHALNPSSHWIRIVHADAPETVLAAARWDVYTNDPFLGQADDPSLIDPYWWPEGEGRKYAGRFMDNVARIRRRRHPHVLLYVSFVHPDHRRQGLGSMLMQWGTDVADKLGLHAFIEASEAGKPLYLKHGFEVVGEGDVTPVAKEAEKGEQWKALERERGPLRFIIMERRPPVSTGISIRNPYE